MVNTISADMVKQLRFKSGARMMDCKQALTTCDADFEKALDWLKQKNLDAGADAVSKPALEGLLGVKNTGDVITVVEMSANTDFAAKNSDFKDWLLLVTHTAHDGKYDTVEKLNSAILMSGKTIAEGTQELAGRIGENIAIKRVVRMEGNVGYYIHFDNKQGALIEMEGVVDPLSQKIGKDIAMHIVFAKPLYLSRDQVPADAVEKEKQIILARLADDPKNSKKPPQIVEKIVTGQLGKFFAQSVLVDQGYYKDEKKTIAEVFKELGDIKVKRFERFHVGVI
jgi:elongation factor Ts